MVVGARRRTFEIDLRTETRISTFTFAAAKFIKSGTKSGTFLASLHFFGFMRTYLGFSVTGSQCRGSEADRKKLNPMLLIRKKS